MPQRKPITYPLTRSEFYVLLRKAAQPIPQEAKLPSAEGAQTSESHHTDGYTETHKSPDTQEGNEK